MEIIISKTAEARGFGSDRFKSVVFLEKELKEKLRESCATKTSLHWSERESFQEEFLIVFNCGVASHPTSKNATTWRVVTYNNFGLNRRVPTTEELELINAKIGQ